LAISLSFVSMFSISVAIRPVRARLLHLAAEAQLALQLRHVRGLSPGRAIEHDQTVALSIATFGHRAAPLLVPVDVLKHRLLDVGGQCAAGHGACKVADTVSDAQAPD
jgi:hypothetical protein